MESVLTKNINMFGIPVNVTYAVLDNGELDIVRVLVGAVEETGAALEMIRNEIVSAIKSQLPNVNVC